MDLIDRELDLALKRKNPLYAQDSQATHAAEALAPQRVEANTRAVAEAAARPAIAPDMPKSHRPVHETVARLHNLPGAVAPSSIATAAPSEPQGSATPATGGLVIHVTYDSSVNNAPASFKTVVNSVVSYLESQFSDNITINISVGWNEIGGQALDPNAIAESDSWINDYTYAQIHGALIASATSSDDYTSIYALPANDPTGGISSFFLTSSEAKALGLPAQTGPGGLDGEIGFSSSVQYDYNDADGVSPNTYDLFGAVAHEITEVMGRQLGAGDTSGGTLPEYTALDLFHFSSNGVLDLSGTTPGYFSVDGGATVGDYFNTDPHGDYGDWQIDTDSFSAFADPGVVLPVSSVDLQVMDVLGYHRPGAGVPDLFVQSLGLNSNSLSFTTANDGTAASPTSYTGVYVSTDSTISTSDTLIGTYTIDPIAKGSSSTTQTAVDSLLPDYLSPGTYYIGAIANDGDGFVESNFSNNASTGTAVFLGNSSPNSINTNVDEPIFTFGGDDTITLQNSLSGNTLTVDGGSGNDTLDLSGGDWGATTLDLNNIETLGLPNANYNLTAIDNPPQLVDASALTSDKTFKWNSTATSEPIQVTGGAGADTISTGNGDDTIDGGPGADIMSGGIGNDSYNVDNAGDQVIENPNSGFDTVYASLNYTLPANVEALTLLGSNPLNGTGNELDNVLTGNAASNTLTGGAGNDTLQDSSLDGPSAPDTLIGGTGNDTYTITNVNDTIVENPGEGTDTVNLDVESDYTLPANVENLNVYTVSSPGNIHVTGNSLANTIIDYNYEDTLDGQGGNDLLQSKEQFNTLLGGDGNDTLESFAGGDSLVGGTGNDTYILHLLGDSITENPGEGTDTVVLNSASITSYTLGANLENLTLAGFFDTTGIGNELDNTIIGNSLDNSLEGMAGNDTLAGEAGTDTSVYSSPRASYTLAHRGNLFTVSGPDGTDTLTGIERLQFSDGTVDLGQGAGARDFDATGTEDLLFQNTNAQPGIWLLDGTTRTASGSVGTNPGTSWFEKGAADFDGDGDSDILFQNANGQIQIWFMNAMTFAHGGTLLVNPGAAWHVIGPGDFDGDGLADILFQNTNGQAAIWLMDGMTKLVGANVGANPGPSWHVIGSGDFNGDGKADILWQNDNGQAAIWLMNGAARLSGSGALSLNPGPQWQVKGAGDFNGDGYSDILWQNTATGQVSIWLMDGTSRLSGGTLSINPGLSWQVKGAEDIDSNNFADIVFQNTNGQPGVWFMDGLTRLSSANIGANPGTSWQLVPQAG